MQDLNDLYYFAMVVDHGGFSAAGRALDMPKSKLSRRIALLEERLGVRLLQRSSRKFVVTDPGRIYYAHAKNVLEEAAAADEAMALTQSEPRGVVRLSCPTALLDFRVGAMLADFLSQYPLVELHVDATDRAVDLIGEGLDIALRVRPLPLEDSDLVLRVFGAREQWLVASPSLLANFGVPSKPDDLKGYPSMDLSVPRNQHLWKFRGPEGEQVTVHHQPRYATRGMVALREAAVAGVGVVQLPRMVIDDLVSQGRLQRLLSDWKLGTEVIHAVYSSRRGMLPAVRVLLEFLAKEIDALTDI